MNGKKTRENLDFNKSTLTASNLKIVYIMLFHWIVWRKAYISMRNPLNKWMRAYYGGLRRVRMPKREREKKTKFEIIGRFVHSIFSFIFASDEEVLSCTHTHIQSTISNSDKRIDCRNGGGDGASKRCENASIWKINTSHGTFRRR